MLSRDYLNWHLVALLFRHIMALLYWFEMRYITAAVKGLPELALVGTVV